MRDYLVFVYLLVILIQVPFYYQSGRDPILFDSKSGEAEKKLQDPVLLEADLEQVQDLLDSSQEILSASEDETSRLGRVEMNRAVLAWKRGKPQQAHELMVRSQEIFREKHGPDSFHVAALDLRIGELLLRSNRFQEALVHFRRGWQTVADYLGERSPFAVRMRFRQVTCLVSLGQLDEAARLCREGATDLVRVAYKQDSDFLNRTGGNLELLSAKGLFKRPPDGHENWRNYLSGLGPQPGESADMSDE